MVGAGLNVFAVWGYIIANARADGTVEVNPIILAATLGCAVGEVESALETLQAPDPRSRSKKNDGRRLIRQGEFLYVIPTASDYQTIRHEAERTEYMRTYMRKYREKSKECDGVNVNVNGRKPPLAHVDVDVDINKSKDQDQKLAPKGEKPEVGNPISERLKGVDAQVAKDFLAMRVKQRAPLTITALAGIENQAAKAGITLEQAMRTCCENGWRGFKADWYERTNGENHAKTRPSAVERVQQAIQKRRDGERYQSSDDGGPN